MDALKIFFCLFIALSVGKLRWKSGKVLLLCRISFKNSKLFSTKFCWKAIVLFEWITAVKTQGMEEIRLGGLEFKLNGIKKIRGNMLAPPPPPIIIFPILPPLNIPPIPNHLNIPIPPHTPLNIPILTALSSWTSLPPLFWTSSQSPHPSTIPLTTLS